MNMDIQDKQKQAVEFARKHPMNADAIAETFEMFVEEVEDGGSIEHEWDLFCDECEEITGERP